MQNRSLIVLGLAILLGLAAVFVANSYLSTVEEEAEQVDNQGADADGGESARLEADHTPNTHHLLGNGGSPGAYGVAYPVAVILGLLFWLLPLIALTDMIFTFVRWRKQSGTEIAVKLVWSFLILLNAYILFFVIK